MFLSQIRLENGARALVAREGEAAWIVPGVTTTTEAANAAIAARRSLKEEVMSRGKGEAVDLAATLAAGRVLLPVDHADPAHLHLTGTGLTHLGSAATRNSMHAKTDPDTLTDSMKMFRMGVEGGKPDAGRIGVQPEWFYKGNGYNAVAPGAALVSPGCALDAGEEPEVAGLYLIGADGTPFRLGWALANEFSDHVTERGNYLWLAHSKLRPASYGPEMLLGDLPADIQGSSRILRDGKVIWEKPFLSGEANMSHSIANLEHHHFKYDIFRQPGDVHVHFFGTATLSFADGISATQGDVWQISAPGFGLALENPLDQQPAETGPFAVTSL
ncbi:GguC protein [Xinfangfangia sp. D13-10-4-6]|uniref:AraD1 family protein n=1 Tax=Pseudogemmobacter hezensis TaxID=2737662 RepID=UPI001552A10B|nr:AraD1 family protein [Pseudogemmobacter hezensis]NPD16380.1 GguC protein [Pseudogemmobacter hezensis]